MNNETQSTAESVNFGHLGIIALCALLLIFTAWMKSGFNFALGQNGVSRVPVVTFDQSKAEAVAQAPAPTDPNGTVLNEQLATVDPGNFGGSVLGASTEGGSIR